MVHSTAPPTHTPTLLPPDLEQVRATSLCQSSSPGKPVYTKEIDVRGGREAEPARAGIPHTLGHSLADICFWPCSKRHSTSPCQCLNKRHYKQLWTIHSKNTGQMGGSVFFKVMSLSPYNGECATWLIMCFQNYKFSDDK